MTVPVAGVAGVAERFAVVRARIERAGGDRSVGVVAVTKTFGLDAVRAAGLVGCAAIGENYAQELVGKLLDQADLPPVHFIGQLQTNKVRLVAPYVQVYETIDRDSLAAEVARRAPGATVLVQVITSGDPGKGGCAVAGVARLVDRCSGLGLRPIGLMTVGPTDVDEDETRAGFRVVRALVDELGLSVCSMGMSDDLELAVQEGSTQVRIGSALFGARPPRTR